SWEARLWLSISSAPSRKRRKRRRQLRCCIFRREKFTLAEAELAAGDHRLFSRDDCTGAAPAADSSRNRDTSRFRSNARLERSSMAMLVSLTPALVTSV